MARPSSEPRAGTRRPTPRSHRPGRGRSAPAPTWFGAPRPSRRGSPRAETVEAEVHAPEVPAPTCDAAAAPDEAESVIELPATADEQAVPGRGPEAPPASAAPPLHGHRRDRARARAGARRRRPRERCDRRQHVRPRDRARRGRHDRACCRAVAARHDVDRHDDDRHDVDGHDHDRHDDHRHDHDSDDARPTRPPPTTTPTDTTATTTTPTDTTTTTPPPIDTTAIEPPPSDPAPAARRPDASAPAAHADGAADGCRRAAAPTTPAAPKPKATPKTTSKPKTARTTVKTAPPKASAGSTPTSTRPATRRRAVVTLASGRGPDRIDPLGELGASPRSTRRCCRPRHRCSFYVKAAKPLPQAADAHAHRPRHRPAARRGRAATARWAGRCSQPSPVSSRTSGATSGPARRPPARDAPTGDGLSALATFLHAHGATSEPAARR